MEGEEEETTTGTETEAEEVPETEPADGKTATETEAEETPPPKTTLDELLAGEQPVAWLAEQLELAGEGEHPITREEIEQLDPVAQRLIANIVKRGQSGAKAASEASGQLAAKEAELAARERLLLARQAETLKLFQNPKLKQFLDENKPKGERPDPDSKEGREWDTKAAFSELMGAFFGKMFEVEQEATAAHQKAEADTAAAARDKEDTEYVDANLEDFRDPELYERIRHHVGKGESIPEAHRLAKAERLAAAIQQEDAEKILLSRRRVRGGTRSGAAIPETPKGLTPRALNEWYEKHPDAMKRDLAEYERKGVGY